MWDDCRFPEPTTPADEEDEDNVGPHASPGSRPPPTITPEATTPPTIPPPTPPPTPPAPAVEGRSHTSVLVPTPTPPPVPVLARPVEVRLRGSPCAEVTPEVAAVANVVAVAVAMGVVAVKDAPDVAGRVAG